jgi:hypothetical protein
MVPVVAPRFALTQCNNEREREFIEALHGRAKAGRWYADSWPRADRVIVTVDICDPDRNCVLRMLRIDFTGRAVAFGPDETYQLVTDLDPRRPGVFIVEGRPEAELADAAGDWLEREMDRAIERQEWDGPGFWRRLWVLADTGERLVVSDSANNIQRPGLGPPDRVVTLPGPRSRV